MIISQVAMLKIMKQSRILKMENSIFTISEMLYTVFLATILIPPASYRHVPAIVVYYERLVSYSKV